MRCRAAGLRTEALRSNFVAARLDEAENRARKPGNPGNVGLRDRPTEARHWRDPDPDPAFRRRSAPCVYTASSSASVYNITPGRETMEIRRSTRRSVLA